MFLTYKGLRNIHYPAFLLNSDNYSSTDGLVYIDNQLVDDRNQPGLTLGVRRLQTPFEDIYELRKAVDTPTAMLKQPNNKFWIDSSGRMFYYNKTRMAKVKYRRITKIERKVSQTRVWLEGVNFSFELSRPPSDHYIWAGVVFVDDYPWILYDFSEIKLPDLRRKI